MTNDLKTVEELKAALVNRTVKDVLCKGIGTWGNGFYPIALILDDGSKIEIAACTDGFLGIEKVNLEK